MLKPRPETAVNSIVANLLIFFIDPPEFCVQIFRSSSQTRARGTLCQPQRGHTNEEGSIQVLGQMAALRLKSGGRNMQIRSVSGRQAFQGNHLHFAPTFGAPGSPGTHAPDDQDVVGFNCDLDCFADRCC
jgi:hypothetical protein